MIRIIDNFKNKDLNVFISGVTKAWPHINDTIDVGDTIWRTEDWQSVQMEKLNQLFNELNKNQDILIQTLDFDRETIFERRYMYVDIKNVAGSTGIYGHPIYGIYGTAKYGAASSGAFILGHSTFGILGTQELGESGTATWTTIKLQQGNNTYKEYLYDNVFNDTSETTATWNTTTKEITFATTEIAKTLSITKGTIYAYFTLSLPEVTGTLTYEISGDGGTTWQTATLDVRTAFTLATKDGVKLKITNNSDVTAKIENTYEAGGRYDEPAITIKLEE